MQYADAIEYLNSFIDYERMVSWEYPEAFKLDRMRALAKELGNPQKAYESILIAGSKGKGSTAVILSSILRMENLRVGLYTSPHLVDLRERIRVNGLLISQPRLAEIVRQISKILEDYSWKKNPPTYFEILTAVAFSYFKEAKVHIAVLEVGLGGLFDSTNIVEAKVAGIAPISLEHTDKLGKTLSKIAVQKCGIIKGREIVVSGVQSPEAEAVIAKTVQEKEAALWRVGREIKIFDRTHGEDFQKFDIHAEFGDYYDLELGLLGAHQMENAAQAVGLAKAFEKKSRIKISEAAVRQGILDAHWPGRIEKWGDHPLVVLDGAHNADSVKRLMDAVYRHFHFHRLVIVIAVSTDKDLKGILDEILTDAFAVVVTEFANPRALKAEILADRVKEYGKDVYIEKDPVEAVEKAKSLVSSEDLVLVTGSLFLLGDIKINCVRDRHPRML